MGALGRLALMGQRAAWWEEPGSLIVGTATLSWVGRSWPTAGWPARAFPSHRLERVPIAGLGISTGALAGPGLGAGFTAAGARRAAEDLRSKRGARLREVPVLLWVLLQVQDRSRTVLPPTLDTLGSS